MVGVSRIWWDAIAGVLLLIALAVVVVIDRRPGDVSAGTGDLQVRLIRDGSQRAGPLAKLKLAVTPTDREFVAGTKQMRAWDDMGKLLDQLGEGFRYETVQTRDIAERPETLDQYDVLFLTCGRGGEEMARSLERFVARGGTLYASDFRFDAVAAAFPDLVDREAIGSGLSQDVVADVVDPALRDVVGATIPLRFDLGQWKVAAFAGDRVTPLIRGAFKKERFRNDRVGVDAYGAFLVKFTHGKGVAIFTSFHNEKQNSATEIKLLEHLVFQLVNASADAEVEEANQRDGFQKTKSNLLSAPKGNPQVVRKFVHEAAGPLRFSLAFRNEGAKLRVALRSPDGKTFHWEGTSTLILEIPDANTGEWQTTITAVQLPFENFPFAASFGAKK